MFWRTLLTMDATTTMPYYYSLSLNFRQAEIRARSLFVVHKSLYLRLKGLESKQGVRRSMPITLLFNFP